jgi:nitronate monooxygenase
MSPDEIGRWSAAVRDGGSGPFQLNMWIPDTDTAADPQVLAAQTRFLRGWTEKIGTPGDGSHPLFAEQFGAMLAARPAAISSIMGTYPASYVAEMKARRIPWFATATTVREARAAAEAGAEVIIAQGAEAGGHRGSFNPDSSEREQCGLFALLPAIVDAVEIPVIAAGGIADARGVAAAFMLGAAAIQIGTGFLRAAESNIPDAWKGALAAAQPEDTMLTRIFTGRCGRALATDLVHGAAAPDAPPALPHPLQRTLTRPMTFRAKQAGDISRMQAWSGQSAHLAQAASARTIAQSIWEEAVELLR